MSKRITSLFALTLVAALLTVILLSGAFVFAESDDTEAKVIPYTEIGLYLDDEFIGKGMLIDSTTYIPICGFCETVSGEEVTASWDSETSTAVISLEGMELTICTDNNYFSCNDRYFYVPSGIYNINGTILLPAREAAKLFNLSMTWDSTDWTIHFGTEEMQFLENGATFYNEDDLYWLARAISSEAGNQPMEGMIGVGNVIMNRAADEYSRFGKGIYGVIFQPYQFSVVNNGMIYNEPSKKAVLAAKFCLEGYSTVGDALYFLNPSYVSSSPVYSMTYVCTIGDHNFYA